MKILIILFCFLFSISYSQNKNNRSNFIQEKIQTCRIPINDTLSVYDINYILFKNKIKIILKTKNTITKTCHDFTIKKDILKEIYTNVNPIIKINNHFVSGISITNFTNLIPNKIIAIKERDYSIIIFELYSFSYSTVGSGYIYLCCKLDSKGNVIENKMIELKTPMKINKYKKVF